MASSSSQRRCVFVGNIPYDATEEQLMQICEEVGPVVSFRLVLDRETGKPKGYGFCEYKDEETALSARRNLHGYEINGRQLRVDFAENDKSTDRGREQGRGGPGLASSTGAPSILGDSSLHQPIGQQLAASAASAMAKALGEAQTSGMSSSGPQGPSGADPLTHYLAKISRHQLSQIMTEMKALATQNGPLARQLLQSSLQLPKALFQAQIMLNMVTPQMLQMPNLRQPSLDGLEAQKPIIPPFHGQSVTQPGILAKLPDGQVSGLAQSHLIPVQPQLQHLPSAQAQHLSQAVLLGKPGVPAFSQPLGGLSVSPLTSVVTSKGLLQQIQTPSLQQDRLIAPTAGGIHSNISIQQPLSGRLPSTQRIPSAHIPGEHGAYASLSYDSAWGSQARMAQDGDHPSKRLKLEEVTSAPQAGGGAAFRTRGGLAQAADAGLPAASQMIGADGTQQPDKQALQLPQDMHKVLLEQVKSLTAEQLSLLPPEQRQQVIDLQQRLRLLEGLDAAS